MDPSPRKEGKNYSDLCVRFPIKPNKGNKYIHIMYVYFCNGILTTEMKKIGDKEMIRYSIEFITDLKIREINPGLHFMYNEASTALIMTMTTMDINYHFPLTHNHRAKIS